MSIDISKESVSINSGLVVDLGELDFSVLLIKILKENLEAIDQEEKLCNFLLVSRLIKEYMN